MIAVWGSTIDTFVILVVGCLGTRFPSPQDVPLAVIAFGGGDLGRAATARATD